MNDELKANLGKKKTWVRGLYMLLFFIIYSLTEVVIGAVVVIQFLFALFTGQTNARLVLFGRSLSLYVYQIMLYLTFNSEDMPYPFNEWPAVVASESTQTGNQE